MFIHPPLLSPHFHVWKRAPRPPLGFPALGARLGGGGVGGSSSTCTPALNARPNACVQVHTQSFTYSVSFVYFVFYLFHFSYFVHTFLLVCIFPSSFRCSSHGTLSRMHPYTKLTKYGVFSHFATLRDGSLSAGCFHIWLH